MTNTFALMGLLPMSDRDKDVEILPHALREFEDFSNGHRPHRTLRSAAPLGLLPDSIAEPTRLDHLSLRRKDRLGGVLREYQHAV
jgi:putative transposase